MTPAELGALADSTTMRPCTRAQVMEAGLCTCPVLLDLEDRPGWPYGGAVLYVRHIDWSVTPRRAYAELWAVSGHGKPGEAFWARALLAEVPSFALPDRTEDERAALLAAIPVPE